MHIEHSVLSALSGRELPNEEREPDQRCYWDGDPFQIFKTHSETLAVVGQCYERTARHTSDFT